MLAQEEVDRQASGVKEEAGLGGQTLQGNLGTGVTTVFWTLPGFSRQPRPVPAPTAGVSTSLPSPGGLQGDSQPKV